MLKFGLADFQLVHPTEMESFSVSTPTGQFEPGGIAGGEGQGPVRAVIGIKTDKRRKRVPIEHGYVVIRGVKLVSQRDPQEFRFDVDKFGRAICGVPPDQLPQLPMDCDYEFYGPRGLIERGKVRCGGNESVKTTEVVFQGA